jgi:PAS domain S-box-containing protein
MKRPRLDITARLVFFLIAFAALLLAGVGALAYTEGRDALQKAALAELLSSATEKEAALESWLFEARNDIAVEANAPFLIASAAALQEASPDSPEAQAAHDQLVQELEPFLRFGNKFTALLFLNPQNGQVLAATHPNEEGKFKENQPFFINGKKEPYVSEAYYSITLQAPAITAAAPLFDPDGELLGVLAARLDMGALDAIIARRTGMHQSDDVYLVNASGLYVTQPRFVSDPAVLRLGSRTEAARRCLEGSNGVLFDDNYRGVPVISVYRWLPEWQVCLLVELDQAEVTAASQAFGRTVVLSSAVVLLVAAGLAIGLARTFTGPILALQAGVTRLGRGELDYRVAANSHDEIGRLAVAFNEMAANLRQSIGETAYSQRVLLALSQAAQSVLRGRTPDEIYATVGQGIRQLGYHCVLFMLPEEHQQHLNISFLTIESDLIERVEKLIGFSPLGYHFGIEPGNLFDQALTSGQTCFSNQVAEVMVSGFPQPIRSVARQFAASIGFEGAIFSPLKGGIQGKRIGVLVVMGKNLLETDVPAVTVFANQTAIALENARLFQEIGQSEARFRKIIETAPDAIVMVDPVGRIQQINSQTEALFGYPREELLDHPIEDLLPDQVRSKHIKQRAAFHKAPKARAMGSGLDLYARRKDGSEFPVDITLSPIRVSGETHIIASVRDITERKQSERLQQVLYRIAQAAITTGTLDELFDVIHHTLGELLPVVNFYIALYDPDSDMLSFPFFVDQYDDPPPPKKIGRGLTEYVLRTKTPLLATPEVFKDLVQKGDVEQVGSVSVDWLGVPLNIEGKPLGVMAVQGYDERVRFGQNEIDILAFVSVQVANAIERKRAEEQIQTYAAKLERSNRDLQDFAYIASHDLQEPLRKVTAFGDRLVSKYGEALDETGRDYLARMQNATQRMQNLINSLLALSRVTTKGQPFTRVDLAEVTGEVLSDLETRIKQSGGRVEIGELPVIEADPTQMRQLLQNLIGNALKFHEQDQTPVVKVSGKQISARSYQVTVEDNGIGFDPQFAERIFQPFQRLHGRGEYEGSGIGLAICRRIVERHGGSILAESTPGQGAAFIVTLPGTQPVGNSAHQ